MQFLDSAMKLFVLTYFIMVLMYLVYLNIKLFLRLDYFPILERSSRLVMMTLNLISILFFLYPLVFYFNKDDFMSDQKLIYYMDFTYSSFHAAISILQCIRGLRIYYVISHSNDPTLNKVFKNEFRLTIWLWMIFLLWISIQSYFFDLVNGQNHFSVQLKIIIFNFITTILLILMIYKIRNVKQEYNISDELKIIVAIQIFQDYYLFTDTDKNINSFYCQQFLLQIKYIILVYFQVISPLKVCTISHPIQCPYQMLSSVQTFLEDAQNSKIFFKYMTNKHYTNLDLLLGHYDKTLTYEQTIQLEQIYQKYQLTKSYYLLEKYLLRQEKLQERLFSFGLNTFTIIKVGSQRLFQTA